MVQYLGDTQSRDFHIAKAVIKSPSANLDLDIASIVSEITVYEHIDKPYITGTILLVDTGGLFDGVNFQGGEILELELTRSIESELEPVSKTFIVDSIMSGTKVNESTEVYTLHLSEDIGFTASLININKTITGQPYQIIQEIAEEFLDKKVNSVVQDNVQQSIKVIVPNMNPIETMIWVKNRAYNQNGFPFYLYSCFSKPELQFRDLESIISSQTVNDTSPFMYINETTDATSRLFKIHEYKYEDAENIGRMIKRGVIGGTHNYYSVYDMSYKSIKFNAHEDMFNQALSLSKRQTVPNLSRTMKHKEQTLTDYNAVNYSSITDGRVFSGEKSYSQDKTEAEYKNRIVAASVKSFMTKQPMEITVDGREFLNGEYNFSIGNNIKIIFKPNYDPGDTTPKVDIKKSGDYTIFAARHVFQDNKYFVQLLCGKLANYNSDNYPEGTPS